MTGMIAGEPVPTWLDCWLTVCSARKCRRSSAMSLAVVYRSEARFDRAFRQMRSSSFGMSSSYCRGGRGSRLVICSSSSACESATKRPPSHQQFVEDDAQAEDVAAAIDPMPFAAGLLRTHVGGRPGIAWPLAHILLPQGQPEIGHERLAALVEQNVARLDVPMHQPLLVGVVQCLGHRRHQFDRFVQR